MALGRVRMLEDEEARLEDEKVAQRPLPTPAEIQAKCLQIQSRWSNRERRHREPTRPARVTVTEVRMDHWENGLATVNQDHGREW